MHKRIAVWVVTSAVILTTIVLGARALAENTSAWINSPLSINKQSEVIALPHTASGQGNIDCINQAGNECYVATDYGIASNGSKVNFSGKFEPVVTYIDGREHFFPIPNSNTAISVYSGGAVYGLNLAFNTHFTSSIVKEGNPITGYKYRITSAPDAKLTDRTNHLLAADTLSMSFSQNSRWLVLSSPNLAMLRVDLKTFEVLPFAPGLNYTIGFDPNVRTAISNDGRYAVVISYNFNTFKMYDLSTCSAAPDRITGSVTCQSRDLKVPMQNAVPNYSQTVSARFMSDDTLATYASYKSSDGTNKIARYLISDKPTSSQIDYLALGDSYISGEGAFDYAPATDTLENKCHLSFLAYPFLIGKDLDYNSYHSVACSGALTNDITDASLAYTGQADNRQISRFQRELNGEIDSILNSYSPGYIDQLDFVDAYQPQALTVSVGGDDMGFSKLLIKCLAPHTCYNTYEDRLELVQMINTKVFNNLVNTYSMLKSAGPPNMRIYAIGYPQIARPGSDCGVNVHLNADEVLFSQELIDYLDSVIQAAAAKTGVYYVDTQDALYGHRFCEAGPGTIAVNGLTAGNDLPAILGGPIGNESYHPNAIGYKLLENKILAATNNLANPMPPADPSAAPPATNNLPILDVLHSGRGINTTEYDPGIGPDLAYQQVPVSVSISGSAHVLPANTNLTAELHSDVISLGNYKTDQDGDLTAQITLPVGAPTGYHTLHFYGTDITGQAIDIYKYIYVAKSADDLDGDGVLDSTQKCVGVPPAGVDYDKDGIDDACDANINLPPAEPSADGQDSSSKQTKSNPITSLLSQVLSTQTNQADRLTNITPASAALGVGDELPAGISTGDVSELFGSPSTNNARPSVAIAKTTESRPTQNSFDYNSALLGLGLILTGILGLVFKQRT